MFKFSTLLSVSILVSTDEILLSLSYYFVLNNYVVKNC